MTQLKWQDSPDETPVQKHPASSTSVNNPWFAVTMGLIGIIVGYLIGKF